MRLTLLASLAAAALAWTAGSAFAIDPHDATSVVAHIFDAADADGDGAVTAEEYTEAGLERFGVSFEACDADGDGLMTMGEYLAFYEMHHGPADGMAS